MCCSRWCSRADRSPQDEGTGFPFELVQDLNAEGRERLTVCAATMRRWRRRASPRSARTSSGYKTYETAQSQGGPSSLPLPATAEHRSLQRSDPTPSVWTGSARRPAFSLRETSEPSDLQLVLQSARAGNLVVQQWQQRLQLLHREAAETEPGQNRTFVWFCWCCYRSTVNLHIS